MRLIATLFLLVSAGYLVSAADCAGGSLSGLPEDDWWRLREKACGSGASGNFSHDVRTLDGATYQAVAFVNHNGGFCWDAMANIITQCIRQEGKSSGKWSLWEESYSIAWKQLTAAPWPPGVSAFHGQQSGIGSWYRASASGDSTNGRSWCGFPYNDWSPVFAPDISQMTNGSNAVWGNPMYPTYIKNYCGLEAIVTNPNNGKSMTLYIGDAFDHRWVRTPGSIDIMKSAFGQLFGRDTSNKNDVIKNVQWKLTGNRNPRYSAGGSGN